MNLAHKILLPGVLAAALLAPRSARAEAAPAPAPAAEAAKPAAATSSSETSTDEDDKPRAKNAPRTLADRIRPVSGNLFYEKGRTELSPGVDISLNDPFFQKYMLGVKLAYHLTDAFSLGLRASYGFSMSSGAVNVCTTDGCKAPDKGTQLTRAPGNISLIAGLDAAWAPLYGKVNFFGEKVLHFDTFVVAGVDGIQYADPSADGASAFTFGGHFGVGQHYVINEFSAIRVDLRDYLYSGHRDVNGTASGSLENQLMLEIGFSFFFPLHPNTDT